VHAPRMALGNLTYKPQQGSHGQKQPFPAARSQRHFFCQTLVVFDNLA